jgi:hypothetical protein
VREGAVEGARGGGQRGVGLAVLLGDLELAGDCSQRSCLPALPERRHSWTA